MRKLAEKSYARLGHAIGWAKMGYHWLLAFDRLLQLQLCRLRSLAQARLRFSPRFSLGCAAMIGGAKLGRFSSRRWESGRISEYLASFSPFRRCRPPRGSPVMGAGRRVDSLLARQVFSRRQTITLTTALRWLQPSFSRASYGALPLLLGSRLIIYCLILRASVFSA